METLSLLKHSRKLSGKELAIAKRVCEEMSDTVRGRSEYIRLHGIDEKFALPDANWSYDAPNEFVRLFRRIANGATDDLNALRGFSQVFTGFNLYQVTRSEGLTTSDLQIGSDFDAQLAPRLQERNLAHVHEHHRLIEGLPPAYVLRAPALLGEVGHVVGNGIVNYDTNAYQERINILHAAGILSRIRSKIDSGAHVRVCEIGGGYGALALWFKQTFPTISYTIIDLPESLLFSRLYLTLNLPDASTGLGLPEVNSGIRFVPNHMAEECPGSFDLIINTLSMSEMNEHQIRKYAHLMRRSWLADDGIFFEQNQDNRHVGLLFAREVLSTIFEYGYPLHPPGSPFPQGHATVWSTNPLT
jgi:putative sugar O-methyltransferase